MHTICCYQCRNCAFLHDIALMIGQHKNDLRSKSESHFFYPKVRIPWETLKYLWISFHSQKWLQYSNILCWLVSKSAGFLYKTIQLPISPSVLPSLRVVVSSDWQADFSGVSMCEYAVVLENSQFSLSNDVGSPPLAHPQWLTSLSICTVIMRKLTITGRWAEEDHI